jgi:hypothetical protein
MMPLSLVSDPQGLKRRGIIEGQRWVGMMTAEELARPSPQPLPAEPNYALGRVYALTGAKLTEERSPTGPAGFVISDLSPMRNAGEFLDGGLLALGTQSGPIVPVMLRSPSRLLVLHRAPTGPGSGAGEMLTCVGNDGNAVWRAPLGMVAVAGGMLVDGGLPSTWMLLVIGRGGGAGRDNDAIDKISRVSLRDGSVRTINIPALPVAGLRLEAER